MKPGEIKTEPKSESFDESDKSGATAGQQSTSQTASNNTTTTTFIDTISNSEGNEILVLVPASNANGLTTANITTEYTTKENNTRKLNDTLNFSRDNNQTRNIVTEQIVWIPKIEAQSSSAQQQQQQQQQNLHSLQVSSGNADCQPPPLYSRIMQLNYSQVEKNINVLSQNCCTNFFYPLSCILRKFPRLHQNRRNEFRIFFLFLLEL